MYWYPEDRALEGFESPRRDKTLQVETVGWRKKSSDRVGEVISIGGMRPVVRGERLLSGRLVVDRKPTFSGLTSREEAYAQIKDESAGD